MSKTSIEDLQLIENLTFLRKQSLSRLNSYRQCPLRQGVKNVLTVSSIERRNMRLTPAGGLINAYVPVL